MASKETSGQSETTQATASSSDDLTSSLTEEGEPPIEVIPVGDDPPIDDKPVIGDEPPVDQESEGYTAEREALRVLHERITELGFDSVFELMREGPALVRAKILSRTPQVMDPVQVDELFDQAQARAAGLTRLYAQLCARSNPALQALTKLEPPEDPNGIHRSIGGSGNYEAWFKQTSATGFAHPDSVGSLFSPASYLTDLYRAAKPLHPSTSGLQLNLRRPDLAPLLLSDANLNEEISTLALTLEVLEAGVTGNVDELLRTSVYPMNLPYNHASQQILQGMAARKSSPAELWSVLGDFEGQALRHDANLSSWATRMPANYARDTLGMSPELLIILTQPSMAGNYNNFGPYYGLAPNTFMFTEQDLGNALKLPTDTILAALGAGPFYDASDRSSTLPSIVSSQFYGASYINGWTGSGDTLKPLYWYIGAALGHPVPSPVNDSTGSKMFNRSNGAWERLNRVIRLQRHVKQLSFEELDWLISQACADISVYPLTQQLQALAVYLPLRQRYGMSVDSFAACLGSLNTFHSAGKPSFYTTLFGDKDLIGMANIDFQQATQNPPSLSARARLCQGLKIDDATLIVLAQFLPSMGTNKVLPVLGLEQISALYRLVAIPRVFGLSVVEALHFWDVLADPDAIVRALAQPQPNQVALGVLIRTGYLVDWMRNAKLEPQQLMALTSRRYPVQATPELQVFIENIYSTLSGRAVVEAALQATEEAVLRTQLARHIGAVLNLKPNIATAALVWVDAVAEEMTSNLEGYNLLSFWADIERVGLGAATLDELPQAVQYAYLMRQFAQACHWAQLGERDLDVLLPAGAGKPSALTGELNAPALTLELLLLLTRYRKWQRVLVVEVAEARTFLLRAAAQDPALTLEVAAQQLSDLHGWDLTQTLVLMNASVPRSFAALLPLLHTMQLSQRLGVSPTDMSWVAKLTGTAVVDPATLTVIAAKIIGAAHA